jgi:hypothetical protein
VDSDLRELSLSHNKISGTLPQYAQLVHLEYLDLAHNKIGGTVTMQRQASAGDIRLNVNRLSGKVLNKDFSSVRYLDILLGNLFTCDRLPHNDDYYDDYVCGSSALDLSLYR